MPGVELAGGFEEQPVLGHRIIDPGAGQNQSVVAAKRRDHDGHSHERRARSAEHHRHHRRGYAVVRRVLDFFQRQDAEVSNVRQQIERDN